MNPWTSLVLGELLEESTLTAQAGDYNLRMPKTTPESVV